jgi:hypothetical protein
MIDNYEDKSDFEINKAVAEYIFPHSDVQSKEDMMEGEYPYCVQVIHELGISGEYVSYCNNPSDAWPIIESIWWELLSSGVGGVTRWAKEMRSDDDSDKLRAAMIVFLKMQSES